VAPPQKPKPYTSTPKDHWTTVYELWFVVAASAWLVDLRLWVAILVVSAWLIFVDKIIYPRLQCPLERERQMILHTSTLVTYLGLLIIGGALLGVWAWGLVDP
jgi:hypothetical protein